MQHNTFDMTKDAPSQKLRVDFHPAPKNFSKLKIKDKSSHSNEEDEEEPVPESIKESNSKAKKDTNSD